MNETPLVMSDSASVAVVALAGLGSLRASFKSFVRTTVRQYWLHKSSGKATCLGAVK